MKMEITKIYLPDIKNPRPHFHCKDETGKEHIVDIWVDGTMPEDAVASECIGKFIVCDYLFPYTEIAMNPAFAECPTRESAHKEEA